MYAAAHTSVALAAKRVNPAASLAGLMVAAQASELLWVGLTYAGVEHSTVDENGTLHLEYMPYSHSLLVGLGGAVAVWAALRWLAHRADIAAIFGLVVASHVVLDVLHHEPDVRVVPWLNHPALGLNLTSHPWLDFAVETGFCIACWAHYRGGKGLLAGILALNVLNLPLMLAGEGGAAPMAQNGFMLPTVILGTIVLAWVVTGLLARRQPDAARDELTAPQPATA
jgi:hypothetical protein